MEQKRKIKLMTDYECWCLWDLDDPTNIDPETLPLSQSLKSDLGKWERAYSATLNHDDPLASGFPTEADSIEFNEQGWRLWERLKEELPDFQVVYFDNELNMVFDEHPTR